MRHLLIILFSVIIFLSSCSREQDQVVITTDMGEIVVALYNSTPKHRDNFLKLVDESYYDNTLFHRVIKGFMIQAGDPDSKTATAESLLGNGGPGYTIKPEFKEMHFRGALAAARLGDNFNPDRESSGSQFYIVQGSPVTEDILINMEMHEGVKYTKEQKERYFKEGGTPLLDGKYTVFGYVVSGMEVVDKIAEAERGVADRPLKDIRILGVKRLK